MAGPAADYYIWGWKKAIDDYGVYGMKSDNGLRCRRPDRNIPLGLGWYDDEGKLQGTYPFFATRALAKRFYWLFHVYRKEKYGEAGQIRSDPLEVGRRGSRRLGSRVPRLWGLTKRDLRPSGTPDERALMQAKSPITSSLSHGLWP